MIYILDILNILYMNCEIFINIQAKNARWDKHQCGMRSFDKCISMSIIILIIKISKWLYGTYSWYLLSLISDVVFVSKVQKKFFQILWFGFKTRTGWEWSLAEYCDINMKHKINIIHNDHSIKLGKYFTYIYAT